MAGAACPGKAEGVATAAGRVRRLTGALVTAGVVVVVVDVLREVVLRLVEDLVFVPAGAVVPVRDRAGKESCGGAILTVVTAVAVGGGCEETGATGAAGETTGTGAAGAETGERDGAGKRCTTGAGCGAGRHCTAGASTARGGEGGSSRHGVADGSAIPGLKTQRNLDKNGVTPSRGCPGSRVPVSAGAGDSRAGR